MTALRRDFLAFTAGAVAARTVLPIAARAAEPHPDAAVFAACAAFAAADAAVTTAYCVHPDTEHDEEVSASDAALSAVAALRPITMAGMRAKAAVIATAFRWPLPATQAAPSREDLDPHEWAAWTLLGDLAAMGRVGA